MHRFRGRVIEYTGMYVVIFTVMFTFELFATYFLVLNIFCPFCLTESELNKANKYIYF